MSNIVELIDIYRNLLNSVWVEIRGLAKDVEGESLLNDWKQANWELVVEANLSQKEIFLEPYGEGADFYGDSSRIIRPDALPTHAVCCYSEKHVTDRLSGNQISFPIEGFELECFVSMRDGWYYEEPPFEGVLVVHDDEQLVFQINDINFGLRKIISNM